jgi:hypothetical protein
MSEQDQKPLDQTGGFLNGLWSRRATLASSAIMAAGGVGYSVSARGAVPEGPPLSQDTVDTIAALKRLTPSPAHEAITVLGYYQPGDGGGGLFIGDPSDMTSGGPKGDDGIYIKPTTGQGRWKRVLDNGGVFNVRHFGAKGDNQTDDSDAIQRAVNACILGPYVFGTVYFPRPREINAYLIRQAIKVPRFNQGGLLHFLGDGALYSAVSAYGCNAFEEANAPLPGVTNEAGVIAFEQLSIGARDGYRAITYYPASTFQFPPTFLLQDMFFEGAYSGVEGLVRIKGTRSRLSNCTFVNLQAPSGKTGIALWNEGAGTSLINCRTDQTMGALIKSFGSELTMIACRAEGASGIPSWYFQDSVNITIINAANEGKYEHPALFHFVNCGNVVLINPQLAAGDADPRPDGIRFENCRNCHVIDPLIPIAFSQYDPMSKAVRADEACQYIRVEGAYLLNGAYLPEYEFDLQGTACFAVGLCGLTSDPALTAVGLSAADTLRVRTEILLMDHPEPSAQPLNTAGALYIENGMLKYRDPHGQLFNVSLTPST